MVKSPLWPLIGELNGYIEDLNRFRRDEDKKMDSRYCFMRLCKYYGESGEAELCIPLRLDHNREDKRVLVRFLRDGAADGGVAGVG